MEKSSKLPLFKVQRDLTISQKKIWLIKIIGIVTGIVLCALLVTLLMPGKFFDFFYQLGFASFGSGTRVMAFLEETALLLIIALALTPAFRMKFWNIGAEGQVLAGALATYAILKYVGDSVPLPILFIFLIAGSVLAGVLWAIIPALFKAFFNTNETLFTLMMNYIAMGLIVYLIAIWSPGGTGTLEPIYTASLPTFVIDGTTYYYLVNIIVVAVMTAIMFVYIRYTKHGYEIDVVGGSQNTARYIGINVKKVIIRTMALSGAICGLTGFLIVCGSSHTVSANSAAGRGFTAVLICWLSGLNPIEMILSSSLVAFISKGSAEACSNYYTNGSNFADIMVGAFFFVIIASTFFTKYKVSFPRWQFKKLKQDPVSIEESKGDK